MKSARLALSLALVAAAPVLATPGGIKWNLASCSTGAACASGTQCTAGVCVPTYRIAASVQNTGGLTLNGAQRVPYQTAISRVDEAFKAWTKPRVLSCNTAWNSVLGGTFSSPSGTGAVQPSDRLNSVIWLSGSSWRYSSTTLALTSVTYTEGTGQILDADMELNNNVDWSDTGAVGTYDYETVLLHEAGHFLGLSHTDGNTLAVMTPTVPPGSLKRSLKTPDMTDVCTVYPGETGGQGLACTSASQCANGRVCESPINSTSSICTADCSNPGGACPAGYSCQASNNGFACLTAAGSSDLCRFCTKGSECSTGVCVTDQRALWCSLTCSTSAQCGAGFTCDSSHFCVPNAGCTSQCSSEAQCAVGFSCTGGTCTPKGNEGDRCEVLGACNSCLSCVADPGDATVAFCRTCCAGQGNGGSCTSCGQVACGSGQACVSLANNKDKVCVPSGGPAVCQGCSATALCQPGLTCVSGRCKAPCNVASPGACTACNANNGSGSCACADEVAQVGQACGQTNSSLLTCEANAVCVSSPTPTCRLSCSPSDSTPCRQGDTCKNLGGSNVCVPSTAATQCAACSATGTCSSGQHSCYANRCYAQCNLNASSPCATCVQIDASGNGLCACDDQIAGPGAACGPPTVAWCRTGSTCIASACRTQCTPDAGFSTCSADSQCTAHMGSHFCLPFGGVDGGVPLSGADAGSSDGGTAAPSQTQPVCGCNSVSFGGFATVAAVWAMVRRRRSSRARHE